MLSKCKAGLLVSLLDADDDSLSSISSQFQSSFDVGERTIALYNMGSIFSDQLLDHCQQIIALWLLVTEFPGISIDEHPFLALFSHLFELRKTDPTACSPQLYDILTCVLSGESIEFLGKNSVQEIMGPTFEIPVPESIPSPSVKTGKTRTPNVIIEKTQNSGPHVIPQTEMLVAFLSDSSLSSAFEPPMVRPIPAVSPVYPGELESTFVSSYAPPPAFFDEFVSIDSNEAAIAMIQRAVDGKLKNAEIQPLSQKIEKNPDLVIQAKLPIEKVEAMIDTTPVIAADVFKILAVKEPKLIAYLSKTLISEANAYVAKSVLMNKELREDAVESYVNGQIKCIQGVRDQQTYVKKIALFCGMLSELFRDGLRFNDTLLVDLFSFCVESKNGTIKEARELQELLST